MPRFRLVFSEHGAALYKGSNMRGALALRLGQVKYQQEPQSDTDVLIIGGLPGVALRQEVERCVLRFTLDLNYDPLTSRLERHIRPATAKIRCLDFSDGSLGRQPTKIVLLQGTFWRNRAVFVFKEC